MHLSQNNIFIVLLKLSRLMLYFMVGNVERFLACLTSSYVAVYVVELVPGERHSILHHRYPHSARLCQV